MFVIIFPTFPLPVLHAFPPVAPTSSSCVPTLPLPRLLLHLPTWSVLDPWIGALSSRCLCSQKTTSTHETGDVLFTFSIFFFFRRGVVMCLYVILLLDGQLIRWHYFCCPLHHSAYAEGSAFRCSCNHKLSVCNRLRLLIAYISLLSAWTTVNHILTHKPLNRHCPVGRKWRAN